MLNSLVVIDLPQDGPQQKSHDCGEDEAGAIVCRITPVTNPELPEDHPELHEVSLGVLVLKAEGLHTLLGDAQLLNQLLIVPARHRLTCYCVTQILDAAADCACKTCLQDVNLFVHKQSACMMRDCI